MHYTLVPLFLLLCCPPTVFLFWYTATSLDGSLLSLGHLILSQGLFKTIWMAWSPVMFGTWTSWKILLIYSAFQIALIKYLPGKPFTGPVTPNGNVPKYTANGPLAFAVTIVTYSLATYFNLISPTMLYDHFGELLGSLNCFALLFCLGLYFKGIFKPSSSDHGKSGNFIFDYYWGTELYPRIFGIDVKLFTNCRFGMMSWGILILAFAAKQQALYGFTDSMFVMTMLQLLYIAKFFLWETGYLRSMDIMHDRAGFYICWGCLVWVPATYPLCSLYLVHHPIQLGLPLATLIFTLGATSILVNYLTDRQREKVRETNGECTVWRKKPLLISARYTTKTGEMKETILLASGWWGLSRHFRYVPELAASFLWASPALFSNFLPYWYVSFLAIILIQRAYRNDQRCAEKYGDAYKEYCEKVPYKFIPYIY